MKVNINKWKMRDADFGPLLPYVQDENVTDINYNGTAVWIDDLKKGRYCADIKLSNTFVERFTQRVADEVSEVFNQYNPLLEAETDTLRISIVHEEYANTGRSISIRKTPAIRRLNKELMLETEYCSEEFLDFVEKCVAAKMNMLMCGLPGTGKTEFLKYLTTFIPPEDRVITIEDNLEIHYADINPGKDCVELKVDNSHIENNIFSYVTAIKACLRQNPQWILLSEARSVEVKHLMESMSTGTHCLTTIHTDDVRKVPDRIKNMCQDPQLAERMENETYMFLDAAILVRKINRDGRPFRYIDQMCFFSREENSKNEIIMVVENGKFVNKKLPKQIMRKFQQANIENPFGDLEIEDISDETIVNASDEVVEEIIAEESANNLIEGETEAEAENESDSENVEKNEFSEEEYVTKDKISMHDESSEEKFMEEGSLLTEQEASNSTLEPENDENKNGNALEQKKDVANESSSSEEKKEDNKHLEKGVNDAVYAVENVLIFSVDTHQKDNEARLRRAKNKQ